MKPILASSLCIASLLTAQPVDAQSRCGPRANVIETLESRYQEQRIGVGVAGNQAAVVELFVSEAGTWTIIVTRTSGVSCMVSAGQGWETVPPLFGEPA